MFTHTHARVLSCLTSDWSSRCKLTLLFPFSLPLASSFLYLHLSSLLHDFFSQLSVFLFAFPLKSSCFPSLCPLWFLYLCLNMLPFLSFSLFSCSVPYCFFCLYFILFFVHSPLLIYCFFSVPFLISFLSFTGCTFYLSSCFSLFLLLIFHLFFFVIPFYNYCICSSLLPPPSSSCFPVAAPLPPSCCSGSATPGQCLSSCCMSRVPQGSVKWVCCLMHLQTQICTQENAHLHTIEPTELSSKGAYQKIFNLHKYRKMTPPYTKSRKCLDDANTVFKLELLIVFHLQKNILALSVISNKMQLNYSGGLLFSGCRVMFSTCLWWHIKIFWWQQTLWQLVALCAGMLQRQLLLQNILILTTGRMLKWNNAGMEQQCKIEVTWKHLCDLHKISLFWFLSSANIQLQASNFFKKH